MTTINGKNNAWDRIMMAITFAEADDAQSARELIDSRITEQHPAAKLENGVAGGNCRVLNTCAEIG